MKGYFIRVLFHLNKVLRGTIRSNGSFRFQKVEHRRLISGKQFFFNCYLETLQHLGHIATRVFRCVPEGCVFLLLCSKCFICYIHWFNFMIYEFDEMDRGNENPTLHLSWSLRKTTKKPQSGWSAPGFEPGNPRIRVSYVTTEPPRSIQMSLQTDCRFLK